MNGVLAVFSFKLHLVTPWSKCLIFIYINVNVTNESSLTATLCLSFFLLLNHHKSHLLPDLIGQQIQNKSDCELINFFKLAHKRHTNQSLDLKKNYKLLPVWLHSSWAAQGHFRVWGACQNGSLNLGPLGERLFLLVQGHPAASVWLNITRDTYIRSCILVNLCSKCTHLFAFPFWVDCPNWDSFWQTCIIQTASGTAALHLLYLP